jgi:TolB protein
MKKSLVLSALLFASALSSFAAETPTLTISKSDSIAIALQTISGADGATIGRVVGTDLTLSGAFKITPQGSAGFIVSGTAGGSSLQGKVVDPSGRTVLASTYSGTARSQAHQFADDIVETITGHKGIANSTIAFSATRTGRKEIYVADYDGSNVRQLTHDNALSVAPDLSPDGRRLVYTGYQSGYADIYLINLASGQRAHIIKFPGTNSGAAFSPDGDRLALTVSKDGNPELYTTSTSGGSAHRLTNTRGVESSPTWSPDGSEIIYSYDASGSPQLYRISSSGGRGSEISTGFGYCTEPNWSPDGKKVAFTVRSGGFQIAVLNLDGGGSKIVAEGQDPVWGPDSRHVIFSNGGDLVLLDTVTGKRTTIVSNLGSASEPAWSR